MTDFPLGVAKKPAKRLYFQHFNDIAVCDFFYIVPVTQGVYEEYHEENHLFVSFFTLTDR